MKKILLLPVLCLALLLTACTAGYAPARTAWYTFTDDAGQQVVLYEKPKKVAVLFSSFADIWVTAGGSVAVTVGETVERGFAGEEALLVDGGAGKTIDAELLLAAQPDFVIGSADLEGQAAACRLAEKAGIPSALLRVDSLQDYLRVLKIFTEITGNDEAYAVYGEQVQAQVNALLETTAAGGEKEILFVRAGSKASATKAKTAAENFVCVMLNELGAHNIAEDAPVLLDGLSLEEILLRNPDYIFISTMGSEAEAKAYMESVFEEEGWKDLAAVEEKNYVFLPKELFHFKPNARWAEAYTYLAELLYPELMK